MDALKNFSYSNVATAPSPATSGTSLVVTAGQGSYFPATPFDATIWTAGSQPSNTNAEIVRVTNVSTDTFTITRAQYGTTAQSIAIGYQIAQTVDANLIGQLAPLTGATFTGEVVAPDFKVTGLTGATTATRYVGGTTNGAPVSGTFAVGDFIIDQTATIWVCTTAGTPGTWWPLIEAHMVTRSATATAGKNEVTIFTGSTASQTISAIGSPVDGATWTIINRSSVSVTASFSVNSMLPLGSTSSVTSIVVPINGAYSFINNAGGQWYMTASNNITNSVGIAPGAIPFGNASGSVTDTSSNGGGATGNAGSLLMSYGDIANGGPEWVNFNVHQTVNAVSSSNIVGTYISTGISISNPNGTVTTGANTTNDFPLNVDVFNVTATGVLTIDGYTVLLGDRVLFANQTTQTQNGVWLCTTAGTTGVAAKFCRDNDADTPQKIAASIWQIVNGTVWGSTTWQTNITFSGTLGTTPIPVTNIVDTVGGNNAGSFLMSYGSVQNGPPQFIQLQIHESVQVISTTNIAGTYITTGVSNSNPNGTVTTGANTTNDFPINVDVFTVTATGVLTIDGYTVLLGDRILLGGQTTQTQNGVWLCTTQGAVGVAAKFCRDNDADSPAKLAGSLVQVNIGTANSSTTWQLGIASTGTLGTTNIPVYQIFNTKNTIPVANGGLNATATAVGSIPVGSSTTAYTPLAISATAGAVLTSSGTTAQWTAPTGTGNVVHATNPVITGAYETVVTSATVLSGSTAAALAASTASLYLYTANPTASFTVNLTNVPTTTGQAVTFSLGVVNGATAFLPLNITINGTQSGVSTTALPLQGATNNSITTYYQSGTAWIAADVSTLDYYTITCICTGASAWTMLLALTKF